MDLRKSTSYSKRKTGEPQKSSPVGQNSLLGASTAPGCRCRDPFDLTFFGRSSNGCKRVFNHYPRANNQKQGDHAHDPVAYGLVHSEVGSNVEMPDRLVGEPDGRRNGCDKQENRREEREFVISPLVSKPAGCNEQSHGG